MAAAACSTSENTVTLLGEPNSREEIFEASLRTLERLRRLAEP